MYLCFYQDLKEIQEISELQQPKKRKKNLINQLSLKHIFSKAESFKQFDSAPDIDIAPEEYDPYHRMRDFQPLGKSKME